MCVSTHIENLRIEPADTMIFPLDVINVLYLEKYNDRLDGYTLFPKSV